MKKILNFKNDFMKQTTLQNTPFQKFVRSHVSHDYFKNEFEELLFDEKLDITDETMLQIIEDNYGEFVSCIEDLGNVEYFLCMQESEYYALYCNKGSIFIYLDDGTIINKSGIFADLEDKNMNKFRELYNKIIESYWENCDITFRCVYWNFVYTKKL